MFSKNDRSKFKNRAIGILILRLFVGMRLVYGVVDNIVSWDHMMEFSKFLEQNNFLFPTVSAVLSVYIQAIGGLMLILGYKTRIAAFILVLNFIVALLMVHIPASDSIEGMTPAMAMLFGSATLFFTGADTYSLDFKKQ